MQNIVTFYKLPFVYGGVTQPYFASDTDRDNFLNTIEKSIVLNNVGIYLQFNYKCDLVIQIDYTTIVDYNFAVIQYNNKKYFANILDIELVSVNKSKCKCIRNPLFEKTNYLQYFTDFKILKSTFKELNYNENSKFFFPRDYRYYGNEYPITFKNKSKDVKFKKFYVFYVDPQIVNVTYVENVISINDISTNYSILLVPVLPDYYAAVGLVNYTKELIKSSIENILQVKSDYVLKFEVLFLPVWENTNSDGITFYSFLSPATITGIDGVQTKYGEYIGLISMNNIKLNTTIVGDIFSVFDVYFGEPDNKLTLELYKYKEINITLTFCLSLNSTDLLVEIIGTNDSIENYRKFYTYSLTSRMSYVITSKSTFLSENRYYDALTINTLQNMGKHVMIDTAFSMGQGAIGIIGGAASGNPQSAMSGVGNYLSAGQSLAGYVVDRDKFESDRKLLAAQEQEKSGRGSANGNATLFANIYENFIYVIENKIFSSDMSAIESDLNLYGIDCFCEEDDFNFDLHNVNGYFYLSAIAVLKYPTTLSTLEYNILYNVLKNGCRYKIFDSNNTIVG